MAAFSEAGATLATAKKVLSESDLLLHVGSPAEKDLGSMKEGAVHLGYLDPFGERELVEKLAGAGIAALSMQMIPRTTLAQKMDALSSQHSIAGYFMVIHAAEILGKVLPMMMTPAGTIQPARVFVIGAGVAGLQAIATAKRLGARVEAFDTRPVVKEQVESLGGKFLEIDLGDTGQTEQGYAKELTDEQKAKQHEGMRKACAAADIVITTAQLFGRKAPVVVKKDVLEAMKPGSVVIDYAVESGGNVEGSKPGEEVVVDGVRVIGLRNYPGRVAHDATRMYASNCYHMVAHCWDEEGKAVKLDREDEIVRGAQLTGDGEILNPMVREHYDLPPLEEAKAAKGDES